jgi:hypothetical protein
MSQDAIPVRLEAGEHVMTAEAAAYYGVVFLDYRPYLPAPEEDR